MGIRILDVELIGYTGIRDGLGLNEIHIDFTKCVNNLIIIRGANGSGKTTILNALSPLPDSNTSFIDKMEARKRIVMDFNGIIYRMEMIHPVKNNGDRATTRGFITKIDMNGPLELNTNGNISSYKDIVFDEFSLDSNFENLSRLSTEDKGIAMKTPSERKKFVNSILSNLDYYNGISKTISKRSSQVNTIMVRLNSKIQSIGSNPDALQEKLNAVNTLIKDTKNKSNQTKDLITRVRVALENLDSEETINNNYYIFSKLYNESTEILTKYDKLSEDYKDSITDEYINNLKIFIAKLESELVYIKDSIYNLLANKDEDARSIEIKSSRLENLDENMYNELKRNIKELESNLPKWEKVLQSIGFDLNQVNLTREEYILGIETIKKISEAIEVYKSNGEYNQSMYLKEKYIDTGDTPEKVLLKIQSLITKAKDELYDIDKKLDKINISMDKMKALDSKPDECVIYTCPFIKEAYEISKQNPSKEKDKLLDRKDKLIISLNQLNQEYENIIIEGKQYDYLNRIVRTFSMNNNILKRLPLSNKISSIDDIIFRINKNDSFSDIKDVYKYIEYCDIVGSYNINKNKLAKYKADISIYDNKAAYVEEILKEINELQSKVNTLENEIAEQREQYLKIDASYKENKENLDKAIYAYELIKQIDELKNNKARAEEELKKLNDTKIRVQKHSKMLSELLIDETNLNKRIEQYESEKQELIYNIKQLDEYLKDYNLYAKSATKINAIKKHSSTTQGIQLLFIELYMHNTISLVNRLMLSIFDGEYQLQQFIINESEFSIPCRGNGNTIKDIFYMSAGQRALISLIISIVMMKQSSSKYNLLRLDEIDAELDIDNKRTISYILDNQIHELGIGQTIMNSHNSEIDLSNCDIILLKMNDEEKKIIKQSGANIIYEFK